MRGCIYDVLDTNKAIWDGKLVKRLGETRTILDDWQAGIITCSEEQLGRIGHLPAWYWWRGLIDTGDLAPAA